MKKLIITAMVSISLLNIFIFMQPTGICENTRGNTLYVGGTGEGNFSSIQNAIDNASDGDHIYVLRGTYYENLTINRSITILGEDKNTTVIDGNNSGNVIQITSDGVSIIGFTIQRSSQVHKNGIYIDSDFNIISDDIIINNFNGISLSPPSDNNTIDGNIIINNSNRGIIISACTELPDCRNYRNNIISRNFIASNGATGIEISGKKNKILGNNVSNNGFHGIFIDMGCSYNIIFDNIISKNNVGIKLLNCYTNEIYGNDITFNEGAGVSLASCSNNKIYYNNFIDNEYSAYDDFGNDWHSGNDENIWYNITTSNGNYWSDFNEPDEGAWDNNSDGIVDKPYNISGGSSQDRFPLKSPYDGTIVGIHEIDTTYIYYMLIIGMIVAILFLLPIAYIWYRKKKKMGYY